jgi:hypothetical protein
MTVTAATRIRALTTHVLENPQFAPEGHFIGRAQMILGLLYKIKRKRALAVQHLTEARRILLQFGQTPILARVETALAELGTWLARYANSPSNAFASFRSRVSNPSVNQP